MQDQIVRSSIVQLKHQYIILWQSFLGLSLILHNMAKLFPNYTYVKASFLDIQQ